MCSFFSSYLQIYNTYIRNSEYFGSYFIECVFCSIVAVATTVYVCVFEYVQFPMDASGNNDNGDFFFSIVFHISEHRTLPIKNRQQTNTFHLKN